MGPDDFDPRFGKLLGPAAAGALQRWSAAMGLNYRLHRPLVNGRSTATVAAVYERSAGGPTRKLILKHDQVPDDEIGTGEYARQREALRDAGEFAHRLTALAHDPIAVPDDSWIVFQEIAGGSLEDARVLTCLVAALPGGGLPGIVTDDVEGDPEALAHICATVVGEMLGRWSHGPGMDDMKVSTFLSAHLADRMQPGRSLAELARRWRGQTITLDGEPGRLPNPFALINDPSLRQDTDVAAIVGPGHGDLHTENVLVTADSGAFWLIDLSRYRPRAPLTQDPVQLVLSIVNRTLGRLTHEQREQLLAVLARGGRGETAGLPLWLSSLITAVRATGEDWIAPRGLTDEWRRATLLSTLACSLIYAARPTTPRESRAWFLRLAARAASAAIDGAGAESMTGDSPHRGLPAETGLAELCSYLYELRKCAYQADCSDDLERLVSRARLGRDIRADLERLATQLEVDLTRGGISDLDSRPTVGDHYRCPLSPSCGRTETRTPGGQEPFCHVGMEYLSRVGRNA